MKRTILPLAMLLAAGCDHGDSKPPLELKKETIRRLDAGSVQPIPVSSPAPQPELMWDAAVPDAGARHSPLTYQAPHQSPPTNQKPH